MSTVPTVCEAETGENYIQHHPASHPFLCLAQPPSAMWDTLAGPRAQAARKGLYFDTMFSSVGQRRVLGLQIQTRGGKNNG